MVKYVIKRILWMIPVILGITLIVFTLINLAPGDPAKIILGVRATPEALAELHTKLGLDDPFWIRYFKYIWNALHGDLGTSYRTGKPVLEELLVRFPVTIKLALGAIFIVVIVGIPIGIISAVKQYSAVDNITLVLALIFSSMPDFWLGTMLILLFAIGLGIVPAMFSDNFVGYILPCVTLAAAYMAVLVRNTRSNMLEVIRSDYITMARAKGASEASVIGVHALRNALLPIITILGMNFVEILGGTVVIENVFSISGIGNLALVSVRQLDAPMIMGEVMCVALFGGIINLAVDVLYTFVDPRLKSLYLTKKRRIRRGAKA